MWGLHVEVVDVCLGFYACEFFEQAHGFELVVRLEVIELAFDGGDEEANDEITVAGLFEYLLSEGLYELAVGGLCVEFSVVLV